MMRLMERRSRVERIWSCMKSRNRQTDSLKGKEWGVGVAKGGTMAWRLGKG
jgi:hypothetical protein